MFFIPLLVFLFGFTYPQAGRIVAGPEFTFSPLDQNLDSTFVPRKARDALRAKILKKCPTCRFDPDTQFIKFADGFTLDVTIDPGVVEVRFPPLGIGELEARRATLQNLIFDSATELGLGALNSQGGGHLNFDIHEAFGDDVRGLRNFLVDNANRPFLSEQIFGFTGNESARPIASLSSDSQAAFRQLITEIDEHPEHFSVDQVFSRLDEVYQKTLSPFASGNFRKTNALVADLKTGRLEMRGHSAQFSVQEFIDEAKLYQAWVWQARGSPQLVPLKIPGAAPARFLSPIENRLAFRNFLLEKNLRPQAYAHLFPGDGFDRSARPLVVPSAALACSGLFASPNLRSIPSLSR